MGIEPGVVKLIEVLAAKGLVTEMSCEGHPAQGKPHAWVQLNPACCKHYVRKNAKRLEQFLLAGEGLWSMRVEYFGKSHFAGLGRPRPRLKWMRRVVQVEMRVTLVLETAAVERDQKTTAMRAMERAAARCL